MSSAAARLRAGGSVRLLRALLEAMGAALWLLAVARLWQDSLVESVKEYDEGLLLTNAQLLLAGKVPYRDFYSNYPPGAFAILAGLFQVFGPSVGVERWVGIVARAAAGIWAGRLVGQITGGGFSAVTAGLVSAWLLVINTQPYAYVLAVQGALLALMSIMRARERGGRGAFVLAGALLGAVSWMRHDLFGLLTIALGMGTAAAALKQRAWRTEAGRWSWLPWLALGVALTAVPFWAALFALAGPGRVAGDLVFDQARYMMPARELPMPSLLRIGGSLSLPAVLSEPFEAAVGLTLIGPLLAAAAAVFPGATGARGRLGAALLGALALAVVPQMAGRTDVYHAVFTVAPALVLIGIWFTRLAGGNAASALLALLLFAAALWPIRAALRPASAKASLVQPGFERAAGRRVARPESRRQVIDFIAEHTRSPNDPVYIGVVDHRYIYWNEIDLYFFANRLGATRYMQFDPNIVNRLDVQQRMAEEIEASGTRVAVLSSIPGRSREPNDSAKEGADYLDRYLRAHFTTARVVEPYVLMLRRD